MPDVKERDRYSEAFADMSSHIGDKLFSMLRTADNQQKLQSLLDPIVSHIISNTVLNLIHINHWYILYGDAHDCPEYYRWKRRSSNGYSRYSGGEDSK